VENLLSGINSPKDIKKLDSKQLKQLASEIREFLVEKVSKTGGHLASNLGVVELTLAIHKVFDSPKDKIVWDVGHQAYVHKILTGRRNQFDTMRQFGGISGFPKVSESPHDCFNTGHSSTSISAALGLAKARDLNKEDYSVIAVIGDGALTGGMAFEALNDAGMSNSQLIVILNDNQMSISKNVGGMSRYLGKIRTKPMYYKVKEDLDIILKKIPGIGKGAARALNKVKVSIKYLIMPGVLFEELGFKYLGPIDGHNIDELIDVMTRAKGVKGPVMIHVCTQKGKGYTYAEKNPHMFHGVSSFEIDTGELKASGCTSYSDVFGEEMIKLAGSNKKICAITAAMRQGTGLEKFANKYPDRFFDVGIAEQHAVTFAAGLARSGLIPVVSIYSTFLQRAYDQILHDVALQKLHVVIAIDRAGLVGEDGETHQGIYDISYLSHIPNLTIMAPCDYSEFADMMKFAVCDFSGPITVRYSKGEGCEKLTDTEPIYHGKGVRLMEGSDISIIAVGNMVEKALEAAEELKKQGIKPDLINARFIKPLDEELISESAAKTGKVVTIEDNALAGGFGSCVMQMLNRRRINASVRMFGFPDEFIKHGSRSILYKKYGLDVDSLVKGILEFMEE